jgi:CDP-diglyceride synthetase
LLLSITFVGTLSEAKQCLVLLFVAWGWFIISIIVVIFAMRNAQLRTHRNAIDVAKNLERISQMNATERAVYRATFSPETNKRVAWLNRIAILGFVFGVIFLCWFVGSNLLANG